MLRSRYNQILLRFAFWEFMKEREPGNIFEMRSYVLKVSVIYSGPYEIPTDKLFIFAFLPDMICKAQELHLVANGLTSYSIHHLWHQFTIEVMLVALVFAFTVL